MSGKKSKQKGKRGERKAAQDLEGKKISRTGESSPDVADEHGRHVEVKNLGHTSEWINDILVELVTGRAQYVVIYTKGKPDALVAQSLSHFKAGGKLIQTSDYYTATQLYWYSLPEWLSEIFFGDRAYVDYALIYIQGVKDALIIHTLCQFKERLYLTGVPDPEDIEWDE